MKHPSEDDIARQLKADAEDEELWSQEPAPVRSQPSRTSVLSLRLPTHEFHALLKAAREAGESVSLYVRKAIEMRRAASAVPGATVNVSGSDPSGHIAVLIRHRPAETQQRTYTAGNPDAAHVDNQENLVSTQ